METITAFGDSVLKGVILENEHYKVTDSSFHKICEESFGIKIENEAKFGSTIKKGESVFERNLETIRMSTGKYVVLEFGGNDCDFNWKEVAEDPEAKHLPMSTIDDFVSIYTDMITERSRIICEGKTYQVLGETLHVDYMTNIVQFNAQVVVEN